MTGRDIAVILAIVAAVVLLLSLLGMGMMGPGMMAWHWGTTGGWWMWIVMVLFWVLLLGGGAWLLAVILRRDRQPDTGAGRNRALDIARERYARGEITRDEYESLRRDLEAH
jgi:putative membrane protein